MALDTNIALGIRPVEQPNMLAQMGQMMQIRQMQQGFESENALRDFYAQGGDLSTAEGKRQLMSRAPAAGMKLIGQQSEISARDIGTAEKSLELYKNQVGFIKSPEDAARWLSNFYANPTTRPYVESVAPMDVALAAIPKNDPAAFQAWLRNASLKAEKLFVDANTEATNKTRIQTANIAAAAPLGQLDLARAKEARSQRELDIVRGILTGNATTPPAASNAPMGGGGGRLGSGTFNIPMGGGAGTQPNVLATQVAPSVTTPAPVNALLNPPAGQTGVAPAANRVDDITRQLSQLAKVGGPVANQAMEGLIKEYNVLNPEGEIKITSNGTLVSVNKRTNKAEVILGADGTPVMGQVAPVTKDVLDPTDPAQKRMITVEVNSYVAGTGLGADGNAPPPKGVLGVATSQIQPNYLRDPNNPQGVIPVPGSAADPNAAVPQGYRKTATGFEPIPGGPKDPNAAVPANYRRTADGQGLEFIPGGPADPAVQAQQATGKLDAKTLATREAAYPKVTSALKSFEAKTKQFDDVITELIDNKKGLDEITGFFAGRTDLSAMSDAGRRALTLFNTITAKGGFSELQDMRNASPTGGALGNVSNQEGKQLIDSFGALSRTQSGNDLRKSLATAKSDLENLKTRMREAYDMTYEYRAGRAPSSGGVIQFGELPK